MIEIIKKFMELLFKHLKVIKQQREIRKMIRDFYANNSNPYMLIRNISDLID